MTLPLSLDERVNTAACKLGLSRALLLREAVRLGVKAAIHHLWSDQQLQERQGAGE